ncbi:MAG: FtsH protease activity modulator HflK [Proteobacteria bacterium]|nr:FtsH protease activity modulator HflK [Pseudomonadota bacterium]
MNVLINKLMNNKLMNKGGGPDQFIKDLNDLINKISTGKSGKKGGSSSGGPSFTPNSGLRPLLIFMGVLLAVVSLFNSFYTIDVSEEGVVTRFGRYSRTVLPGLHFKIPFTVENVTRVKSKIVHQEEFGFRTQSRPSRGRVYSKDILDAESLMLTGDLNVADVEWILQYRIVDSWKYLYKARDVETNIRDVSISIMRRVVGDKLVNDVLTTGRVEIADEAKVLTQEVLDHYDMGIKVVRINLQDVNPPDPVKGAFNEVNAAKQEQEQTINQAEQEYNRRIPEAQGKAEQTIRDAEAFAVHLINHAKGDSAKFNQIYAEYVKAPDITKKRVYLQTMREIFRNHQGLTIIDEDAKGILPVYGPLNSELLAPAANKASDSLSSLNNTGEPSP